MLFDVFLSSSSAAAKRHGSTASTTARSFSDSRRSISLCSGIISTTPRSDFGFSKAIFLLSSPSSSSSPFKPASSSRRIRSMSSSTLFIPSSSDCAFSISPSSSDSSAFSVAHTPHTPHDCIFLSSALDWPLEDVALVDPGLDVLPKSSADSVPLKNTFLSLPIFPSFLIIGNHPSGLANANRILIDAL